MKLLVSFVCYSIVFLVMNACTSSQGDSLVSGHYEGNLIKSANAVLQETPVNADVSSSSFPTQLILKNSDGSTRSTIKIAANGEQLSLDISEVAGGPIALQKSDACYTQSAPQKVSLCFTNSSIQIDIHDKSGIGIFGLSLNLFSGQSKAQLEAPKRYSLEEAVELSFKRNFQSRMEFERMMQARHLASNAYLNLLPHLSINSVLALLTPSAASILSVAGDLVPFLLPDHWFQAAQKSDLSDAESFALITMRGNTGLQMESFAYTLERDKHVFEHYAEAISASEKLRDVVASLESMGQLPPGSRDIVQTSIVSLIDDLDSAQLVSHEQLTYTAQTLGLLNPDGVLSVDLGSEALPISMAKPLDAKPLMEIAETRSFELSQVNSLIAAAKESKSAVYFNWLNPNGDQNSNLGFGLGDSVAIESSKITELQTQKSVVQGIVLQDISNTVSIYNNSLEDYARAQENLKLQLSRTQRIKDEISLGSKLTQIDLANVLTDKLRAEVAIEQAIADFRISRAKLDRLLLQGFYSRLSASK